MADPYLPRLVDGLISDLLVDLPGLLIVGPRASGKTTTARRHARSIVHLDQDVEAEQFRADPDVALAGLPEPVLLDEWQAVPGVLGAVKRAIDSSSRRGRFIVTGSVLDDLLRSSWPVTGRLVRVEMTGLTVRETQRGDLSTAPFFRRIAERGVESLVVPPDPPDLRGYVEHAVVGGYPDPVLGVPASRRARWQLSYLDRLLTRDAADVDTTRDPARLLRFLQAYTLNTAGEVTARTLYEAAGINRRTAEAYERLLQALLLVDVVPAWSTNLLKRLVRAPKRYLRDTGLAAAVLDVDTDDVLRNGDILGRMIETFVLAQLRAELPLYDQPPRLYHLRQEGGVREIDLIAELGLRRVIGLEIKARSAPSAESARHLVWLRDRLGDIFVGGVVLHTGRHVYRLDDRIMAAPICTIWA